jgi:hypothetical protein
MFQVLKEIISLACQAVFLPNQFVNDLKSETIINKYGWTFIVVRWTYYAVIFILVRDYYGSWAPFSPMPLNMSVGTYAFFQPRISIIFGFFLMLCITLYLWGYYNFRNIPMPMFQILNILGITFFLPFVLIQPVDILCINTIGWNMAIIIPLHTIILLWEAIVSVIIIDDIHFLSSSEKLISISVMILV